MKMEVANPIDLASAALADELARGERLSPASAKRLVAAQLPEAIRVALGYVPSPGRRKPETQERHARRGALLRNVARFYPAASNRACALAIARDWKRYAESAWRRDQQSAACPERHYGTKEALFFQLMRLMGSALSAESIRHELGKEARLFPNQSAGDLPRNS